MKTKTSLARAVESYLQSRRQLGFALKNEHGALPSLVRYAQRMGHRGPLTTALALAWSAQSASQPQRACRLNMVRRFARFRQAADPATQIPPPGVFGPGHPRRPVHIYTAQEIAALLQATAIFGPPTGIRVANLRTVLGLMACTGMRVSEALGLQRMDLDWRQHTLTLRRTKSGRTRILVLHATTMRALRAYERRRNQVHPQARPSVFFLSATGRPLPYSTVRDAFLQLRRHLGWTKPPVPRLHDLRHTFAVRHLLVWSARQQPINHFLLGLATYLGHRQVTATYWYFSAIPELLEMASRRFHAHSALPLL